MNNTAEQILQPEISFCKYPFKSYKEAYRVIKVDYSRYKKRLPKNFFDMLKLYVKNHGFSFTFWMRLSGVNGMFYPVCKIMHKRKMTKYGIQIGSSTKIGEGLYIGHGFVIVNPTAKIGSYCNLSQFTTIGSTKKKAATIGNHVYIGPGVCIVEDVHIGNYAKIGAGAVVIKDVPAYATAVGVPARNIIKE